MDPHFAFSMAGTIAILGWLGLILSLFVNAARDIARQVARFAIPALLGVGYVMLMATGWNKASDGGFGSIEQVRRLFSVDALLAAGWLHYLAFDLLVGSWIVEDGLARAVNRFALIPCLGLTFLFGPAGFLLYLALRLVPARRAI